MKLDNIQDFIGTKFIHTFDLKTHFDLNEIHSLLKESKWENENLTVNDRNNDLSYSLRTKHPILEEFRLEFESEEFRKSLVDYLFTWDQFHFHWNNITPDRLVKITRVNAQFKKNPPNHNGVIHQETRNIVCAGMVYFVPHEDINQSTAFYINDNQTKAVHPPTGMGKGWLAMNILSHTHQGRNFSMDDRYTLVFFLNLAM